MAEADHMRRAIALSLEMMRSGRGGPFGAVIVKDGKIIAEGYNQVTSTNDPTAHGEVVAIRLACTALQTFDLTGAEIYTSCEPCPMCLSAIYWARISRIYFANGREDAAKIGFRDDFLYQEIPLPLDQRAIPTLRLLPEEGWAAFAEWDLKPDKIQDRQQVSQGHRIAGDNGRRVALDAGGGHPVAFVLPKMRSACLMLVTVAAQAGCQRKARWCPPTIAPGRLRRPGRSRPKTSLHPVRQRV